MAVRREEVAVDRIVVGGIKFHAFHGFTRLEREVGVRCSIDVVMDVDLTKAAGSDRLRDTIDYRGVHALVLELGRERNSFHLIESLAGRIADAILGRYAVAAVTVRVRKETPLLDGIVDYVGVEVTRRQGGPKSPPPPRARVRRKQRSR